MTILFRTQGIYLAGGVGDTRYFNSASALAKSIETGYIRPSFEGRRTDSRYEVKVFSDTPEELDKFDHEVFFDLMDKYEGGFVFAEPNPYQHIMTPEIEAAMNAWRKRMDKAAKEYRNELTQAIEACYP